MLIYDPERDAYVILGVDTKATPDEIEAAYRKAALTWHPDKTSASDATERFQEARTAADILRDKTKRSEYDHLRRMHLGVRAEGRRQTRPAAAPQRVGHTCHLTHARGRLLAATSTPFTRRVIDLPR